MFCFVCVCVFFFIFKIYFFFLVDIIDHTQFDLKSAVYTSIITKKHVWG